MQGQMAHEACIPTHPNGAALYPTSKAEYGCIIINKKIHTHKYRKYVKKHLFPPQSWESKPASVLLSATPITWISHKIYSQDEREGMRNKKNLPFLVSIKTCKENG